MKAPTLQWFKLSRHLPVGWHPPAASWLELLYLGSLAGTCVLTLCYLWQALLYDVWAAHHSISLVDYLRFQLGCSVACFFLVFSLRLAGWFRPPSEGADVVGRWAPGAKLLFHLRELHGLRITAIVALALCLWFLTPWLVPLLPGSQRPHLPFSSVVRQMLPITSAALTCLLALFHSHQRFHPRAFRLLVPGWLASLLRRLDFGNPPSE